MRIRPTVKKLIKDCLVVLAALACLAAICIGIGCFGILIWWVLTHFYILLF